MFVGTRRREAGEAVLTEFHKAGLKAEVAELVVTDMASIARSAAWISSECNALDVLVNNAAILEDEGQEILKLTPQMLLTTLETNTLGPLRVTQAFWPLLAKAKPGRIINISSEAGSLSSMESYAPAYSVSKAAVNALTRQFAAAGRRDGIVVNSMCPGWVRTDMGGANAARSVSEGADTAIWLATEASTRLTGRFFSDREEISW